MEKEPSKEPKDGYKPNRRRQTKNLAIFNGFWKGIYYENGVPNPGGKWIDEETKMIQGKEYHIKKKKRK